MSQGLLDDLATRVERLYVYRHLPQAPYSARTPPVQPHTPKPHTPSQPTTPYLTAITTQPATNQPPYTPPTPSSTIPPTAIGSVANFRARVEANYASRQLQAQREYVYRDDTHAQQYHGSLERTRLLAERIRWQREVLAALFAVQGASRVTDMDATRAECEAAQASAARVARLEAEIRAPPSATPHQRLAQLVEELQGEALPRARALVESAGAQLDAARATLASASMASSVDWTSPAVLEVLPANRLEEGQAAAETVRLASRLAASLHAALETLARADAALPSYARRVAEAEAPAPGLGALRRVGRRPLTADEEQTVESALGPGPEGELLAELLNVPVHRRDMRTLRPMQWLNDEVVNYYFKLLLKRANDDGGAQLPTSFTHNTHFYPKLAETDKGYNYAGVRRWTKKVDIFAKQLLLVPINQSNMHWTLAVVNFESKRFEYFDSLLGDAGEVLAVLRKYVTDESLDKKGAAMDLSEWRDAVHKAGVPRQRNGYDCGVFMCQNADYISQGGALDFSQEDMAYLRRRMALEVAQGSLLDAPK